MQFITREEIEALRIDNDALVAALEEAFRASRAGAIVWRPKATINEPDGAFFINTMACWPARNLGIFHCIMGAPPASLTPGDVHYRSYQLLTDYNAGTPIRVVDGTFTSTMLPAGITSIGARAFARPDSRIATFIGAGAQARVNLAALAPGFPLAEIRILSRTAASAEGFAMEVRKRGLEARIIADPQAAVQGADLIVSSVPSGPALKPFLDPAWVSPGAFVSAVDLGRSWGDGFADFDRIVADDRGQAVAQHAEGRLRYGGSYDTELSELLAGARPPREAAGERIVMIHPGNVVGVFAITALIHERLSAGPSGPSSAGHAEKAR